MVLSLFSSYSFQATPPCFATPPPNLSESFPIPLYFGVGRPIPPRKLQGQAFFPFPWKKALVSYVPSALFLSSLVLVPPSKPPATVTGLRCRVPEGPLATMHGGEVSSSPESSGARFQVRSPLESRWACYIFSVDTLKNMRF